MDRGKLDVKAWARTWTLAFCSLVAASQGMAEVNEEGVELYEHDLSGMPPPKAFEAGASFALGIGCSSGRLRGRGTGPFCFNNYGVANYGTVPPPAPQPQVTGYTPGSRVPLNSDIVPAIGVNNVPPIHRDIRPVPPAAATAWPAQVNEYGDAVAMQWTRLRASVSQPASPVHPVLPGSPDQTYYHFGDVNARSGFAGAALTFLWDYVTLVKNLFPGAPQIGFGACLGGGFLSDTTRVPLYSLSRIVYREAPQSPTDFSASSTNIFESGSVKLRHFMFIEAGAKAGFVVGRAFSFLKLGWAIHCWRMQPPSGVRAKSCWPNAFVVGMGIDMNVTRRMIVGVAVDVHTLGKSTFKVRQTDLYQFVPGSAPVYDRRNYETYRHEVKLTPVNVIATLQLKLKLPRCREGNVAH